jgi:hypothetical protein
MISNVKSAYKVGMSMNCRRVELELRMGAYERVESGVERCRLHRFALVVDFEILRESNSCKMYGSLNAALSRGMRDWQ